jgi:hypothetical protein
MKTLAVRLVLGTAIVVIGLVGGGAAAQATPTGCTLQTGVPSDGAQVRCTSGTGEVRVVIECIVTPAGRDPIITQRSGAWVGVGATSSAACTGGPRLYEAWFEVR